MLTLDSNNLTRKTRSDSNRTMGFNEKPKMEKKMKKCVCNDIKDILVSSLILKCENNHESGYVSEWTRNTSKKKEKPKMDSSQGKDTWKDKIWRFVNLFNRKRKIEKEIEKNESSTYASSLTCDCISCQFIELKDASTSSYVSRMDQQTQTENMEFSCSEPSFDDPKDICEDYFSKNDFLNFIDEISSVSPISSEIEQCLGNSELRDDFLKFINEINKMPMPQELIERKFSDVSSQTEWHKNDGSHETFDKTKNKRKKIKKTESKNEFIEEYFVVHRKKVEYYETLVRKSDSESQKTKNVKFPLVNPTPNLADEFKKIRFKPIKLPPLEKSNSEKSGCEEILRKQKSRFCHECSSKYLPNAKYCSNCGIKRILI